MKSIIAALAIALSLPMTGYAGQWPFAEPPYAWAGIDYQLIRRNNDFSVFCADNGTDTANLGIGQVLMRRDRYAIVTEIRHSSCFSSNADRNSYDAIGVMIKFNLW